MIDPEEQTMDAALSLTEKLLYFSIIALGAIFLVLGVKPPDFVKGWESVLQGLGGAIFGIGVSSLLSSIRHFDFLIKTSDTLRKFLMRTINVLDTSLGNEFKSEKSALQEFSGKEFHEYHITKTNKNKEGCWAYHPMRFFQNTPTTLSCVISFVDEEGEENDYQCEAGIRNERLIMIFSPLKGKERPGVAIFPSAGTAYKKTTWFGVSVGETFAQDDIVRACILSRKPLIEQKNIGFISKEDGDKLNILWNEGIGMPFILNAPKEDEADKPPNYTKNHAV